MCGFIRGVVGTLWGSTTCKKSFCGCAARRMCFVCICVCRCSWREHLTTCARGHPHEMKGLLMHTSTYELIRTIIPWMCVARGVGSLDVRMRASRFHLMCSSRSRARTAAERCVLFFRKLQLFCLNKGDQKRDFSQLQVALITHTHTHVFWPLAFASATTASRASKATALARIWWILGWRVSRLNARFHNHLTDAHVFISTIYIPR